MTAAVVLAVVAVLAVLAVAAAAGCSSSAMPERALCTGQPCGRDERVWDGATAVATGERGPPEIALSGIEGRIRRGMILALGCKCSHSRPSSLRLGEWIRSGALGRPVAAGRRSRLHMCPALSGALMQATAPHPIVRLVCALHVEGWARHSTAPHRTTHGGTRAEVTPDA